MLTAVARRGDTVMVTDAEDGPGAILWQDGTAPQVIHRDSALAFGYWSVADQPVPRLSAKVITELMMFNQNWASTQATLESLS